MLIKTTIRATVICIAILLAGCTTSYAPMTDGMFGYHSEWIEDDVVAVSVRVNNLTRMDNIADYTIRQAAEQGAERGYTYFLELESEDFSIYTSATTYTGTAFITTPITYPGQLTVFRMFNERPSDLRPGDHLYVVETVLSTFVEEGEPETEDVVDG